MTRAKENVWDYPRPPALQRTDARLRVIWTDATNKKETVLADTKNAYRVLETSHPPTYYIPPQDVNNSLVVPSKARQTMCEWKGLARYHDILASPNGLAVATARAWSYPDPTQGFKQIKDYYSFYATSKTDPNKVGYWTCMVDDDVVTAQEGDFYGSWITPEIEGGKRGFKGGPGTWGW